LITWKGTKFQGTVVFQNAFAQSIKFISKLTCQKWILTNIYARSTPDGRVELLNWFKNIVMPDDQSWIIMGDFNLIQRPKNKNRLGDDSNMMMAFNDAISKLEVIEIPLSGQEFTWTNKQKKLYWKDWIVFHLSKLVSRIPWNKGQNTCKRCI
jgi:hypothetical protein